MEEEREKLTGFYQRHGFLKAAVETNVFPAGKKEKRVDIEFLIRENDPVLVGKVELNFIAKEPEQKIREEIQKAYFESRKLAPGVRFADEDLLHDRSLIKKAADERGYADSRIEYQLNVDTAANRTGIQFNFSAGTKCYLGNTTFLLQGGEPENRPFLLKYISYKHGDIFTASSLEKTQKQIYGIGLYNVVSVVPARNRSKADTIPVEVLLRKASPYKVKFGVGYGREERFRGFVDFQYLGFLGGIRRLNLFLKHSYLEPYRADLKFTQPGIWGIHSSLVIRPYLMKQNEPGYSLVKYGSDVLLNKQLVRNLNATTGYFREVNKLDTASIGHSDILPGDISDYYNKMGVTLGVLFDNSMPLFNPSKGWIFAANAKYSGFGNSTHHFLKMLAEVRNYRLVGSVVFAWKVKYGISFSYDEDEVIPVDESFFAGGSTSVRGWQRSYLGPIGEDDIPLGGKSSFETSLESRIPVIEKVHGVVFMDAGNVWEETDAFRLNELRYAAGAGIRIDTPIGPVRFDLARPVWDVQNKWQWHLSVGHAF